MIIVGRRSAVLLLIGDVVTFTVALYATLFVRYLAPPSPRLLAPFVVPFALLFALWVLMYFVAGLYGKRLALFPSRVPDVLLRVQVLNTALAAIFFFFVPLF